MSLIFIISPKKPNSQDLKIKVTENLIGLIIELLKSFLYK
ncbi:hypothetical protein PL11201_380038 [Planktothrix sp. PCC 11201]|nr:hypothetical protein PL11201_380038 [Planktothrix sp. PCC 11201]